MATIAKGESKARAMLALKEKEARTMLERVRAHAAARPYQTMGAAALAGMLLSTRGGRTLAGWAAVRMGWDVLLTALREDMQEGIVDAPRA